MIKGTELNFKKNMWLYITLFGACAAALGSFMLARQGGVQTDRIEELTAATSEKSNQIKLQQDLIESLQRQTKTEVTNLKYSIPEKLFVKFELTFRFSEEVDFSEILKNYNDNYYLFRFPIQTPEHKAIHSTVSKRLGILQVSGGIMNSSEYSVLIINGKKKMNYSSVPQANNIIELNFPKEINFQYGELNYNIEKKEYNLAIQMFPLSFTKAPNINSLLDLNGLELHFFVHFISINMNSVKNLEVTDLKMQNLFLTTENTAIGEIENIEVVNDHIIKGKVKILEK